MSASMLLAAVISEGANAQKTPVHLNESIMQSQIVLILQWLHTQTVEGWAHDKKVKAPVGRCL